MFQNGCEPIVKQLERSESSQCWNQLLGNTQNSSSSSYAVRVLEQQQQRSRELVARTAQSRDRLDTLIYDTVMHNRHCLMGALLCFLSLSVRVLPLRYFQQRKNPAASTVLPEHIGVVGISPNQADSKELSKSCHKWAFWACQAAGSILLVMCFFLRISNSKTNTK